MEEFSLEFPFINIDSLCREIDQNIIPDKYKVCRSCGRYIHYSNLVKNKKTKDGFERLCKPCRRFVDKIRRQHKHDSKKVISLQEAKRLIKQSLANITYPSSQEKILLEHISSLVALKLEKENEIIIPTMEKYNNEEIVEKIQRYINTSIITDRKSNKIQIGQNCIEEEKKLIRSLFP
jgi:hypothetical protein